MRLAEFAACVTVIEVSVTAARIIFSGLLERHPETSPRARKGEGATSTSMVSCH